MGGNHAIEMCETNDRIRDFIVKNGGYRNVCVVYCKVHSSVNGKSMELYPDFLTSCPIYPGPKKDER
jgi:hypothetical protein